jgi:4-carboxymuconolactone decarboxylase
MSDDQAEAADAQRLLDQFGLGEPSERFTRGVATQRQLDPTITEEVIAAFADVAPDFARLTIEFPFGDIYSRPGLDLKQRQIVTMATLATLGQDRQLKVHIRFARNVGVSDEEIVEVLMQIAVYAGWGRALDALRCAKEVFAGDAAQP